MQLDADTHLSTQALSVIAHCQLLLLIRGKIQTTHDTRLDNVAVK